MTADVMAQLALRSSPYCGHCPVNHRCHEQHTARGCSPEGPPDHRLLHPTKADWIPRLAEVDNVGFEFIRAIEQKLPRLPRYIPRIRLGSGIQDYGHIPAVALSLREVERLANKARIGNTCAKETLGISPGCLLIVLGFENDAFLEDAWPLPRRHALLSAIRDVGADLAVAWGFSVWYRHVKGWDYPRIEQLYNMKRSLLTFADLQAYGVPAIPHVYWGDVEDLERWARWLTDNPAVSSITVDLQTADSPGDWGLACRGLAYLRSMVTRKLNILINGPCNLWRIRELDRLWPGCSMTNFGAYFSAYFRYKRRYGVHAPWMYDSTLSHRDIFLAATDSYAAFIARRRPISFAALRSGKVHLPLWDVPMVTAPARALRPIRLDGVIQHPLPIPIFEPKPAPPLVGARR